MTREEAKQHLETIKIYAPIDGYTDKAIKALDMAIEALSIEPCEDAISRKEAIKAFKRFGIKYVLAEHTALNTLVKWSESLFPIEYIEKILTDLPSIPFVNKCDTCKYGDAQSSVCGKCENYLEYEARIPLSK